MNNNEESDPFYSSPDEMERFRNNMDTQTKDFIKDKLEKTCLRIAEEDEEDEIFTDLERKSLIDSRVNYADKYKIVYDKKNKIHSTFKTKQANTAVQEIEVLVDLYYRKEYLMNPNGWKWWEKEEEAQKIQKDLQMVHDLIPEGFNSVWYKIISEGLRARGVVGLDPDEVLLLAEREREWRSEQPAGGGGGKRRRKKRTKKKSRKKKRKTLKKKRKRRKKKRKTRR